MTQFLPPNLLALFAPREPLPYLPPISKLTHERRKLPYSGIGVYTKFFDTTYEPPVIVKRETREERKERKRREKAEQIAYVIEQGIALWNPHNPSHRTHDAYKTLFVGRINYDTSDSKLKKEFSEFGLIKKLYVIYNKINGKPRGYAFIEYEHERDMHAAYKRADGKKIDSRRVLVDVERGRTIKGWLPRRFGGGLGNTRKAPNEPFNNNATSNPRMSREKERRRSRSRRRRTRSRSKSRDRKFRHRSPSLKKEIGAQPNLLTQSEIKKEKMDNGRISPSEFEAPKKVKKEKRSKRSRSKDRDKLDSSNIKKEKRDKERYKNDTKLLDSSKIKKEKTSRGGDASSNTASHQFSNSGTSTKHFNMDQELDNLERYYNNTSGGDNNEKGPPPPFSMNFPMPPPMMPPGVPPPIMPPNVMPFGIPPPGLNNQTNSNNFSDH